MALYNMTKWFMYHTNLSSILLRKEGQGMTSSLTQFYIHGASGIYSDVINGIYEATLQQSGGKPVYHKCDDSDIWLEYDGKAGEWNVLNTAHRGLSWGYASLKSAHDVNMCEGKSGWMVFDGHQWNDQPSVRLKIISYQAFFVAPEVPARPPPPPPVAVPASTGPETSRHNRTKAAGASATASDASSVPTIYPPSRFAKDSVVKHFDFADSMRVNNEQQPPEELSEAQSHDLKSKKRDVSPASASAASPISPQLSGMHTPVSMASSLTAHDSATRRGSGSSNDSQAAGSGISMSYSQILKHRRLHIDAFEPGHPKVLMRVPNQQSLPVQSLSEHMLDLNLKTLQATTSILDMISAERACAKMCVWGTSRFCKVSENCIDVLLASGQRMQAERDVFLVREGDDASNVIFFIATGQVKFVSKSNPSFSDWSFKRSTVTHSILVCGSVGASVPPNDVSDATVMACDGAVVWRFDVPQSLVHVHLYSAAPRLVVNEEMVLLRSLATELMQTLRDQRTLLVACEAENATLQKALQVQTIETYTQTDVAAAGVTIERDTARAERESLEQTILSLRRQLSQIELDPNRFSAKQRVIQLEQERAERQEELSQISAEYEDQVQKLKAQDLQIRRKLSEEIDARAELELKNAMLHELVKQLEISQARLETDKRAANERFSSLRTVLNAVEERAVHAEQQHQLLLQKINSELQAIRVQSPT